MLEGREGFDGIVVVLLVPGGHIYRSTMIYLKYKTRVTTQAHTWGEQSDQYRFRIQEKRFEVRISNKREIQIAGR